MVQWLGLSTLTAMGLGSIPGKGNKIPQGTQCGQRGKYTHTHTHTHTHTDIYLKEVYETINLEITVIPCVSIISIKKNTDIELTELQLSNYYGNY